MDNYKTIYKWYKDNKICVQCHNRKVYTNHVRCEKCLYKDMIYKIRRRSKSKIILNTR
jgi:ribosomal protein L40E